MSIARGENTAIIQLKLAILNHINEHCGKEHQSRGFYIMKRWLMFDPDIPEDLKEEMLEWYSKTNIEQQEERKLKEADKQTRSEVRKNASLIIAQRHLEHWKEMYAQNPRDVFQRRIREAEEEVIRAGGQVEQQQQPDS